MPLSHNCNKWPDGQHPYWLEHKHTDLVIEVDENRVLGVKRLYPVTGILKNCLKKYGFSL